MNKKSLILSISLVLIVFLSLSMVSAENIEDVDSNKDILQVENADVMTAKEVTVNTDDTNDQIQDKINSLDDGDTLNFQKGEYKNVSLYVNKSITINGNGSTLYGYDKLSNTTIAPIIFDKTTEGGYAITNLATFYILETKGLVLKDINFVAGAQSGTDKGADSRYSNCVIYNYKSNATTISNITVDGCSWGIWLQNCADTIIENNKVMNQGITGIFSFQSPRSTIRNNTVTNAKNHGIDVRHKVGPNAKITNNTVIGSKEGIYLLHSAGHIVTGNTIINCTLSSVTCCGASNIQIYNNKFYYSRIGLLLGGGAPQGGSYTPYSNITLGVNEWKVDELPFPPSFQYYVAEAKADYASTTAMMGTHTDSSLSEVTYVEYSEIPAPEPIVIDYAAKLNITGNNVTITAGMTNDEIQAAINGLSNGDTLIFEENAVFTNISIYIDKNIKVIGNNATLISHTTVSQADVPEKIINKTTEGGYGISYYAVIYITNNTGVVISDLNIKCLYPGYDATKVTMNTPEYATVGIYGEVSKNLTITGCKIDGASWGIFLGGRDGKGCPNAIITNNKISNQYTTGILNFGGKASIIANNTIINAKNHGIDVRFKSGSGVTVFNNTISGSKEGIYLLHSEGHKVYGNTIKNSKISSITCYGSGNEYIFNNTLLQSRIAIILGGGYYNVTIGKNSFTPDKLPFPPTFEYYLVKSENKYYNVSNILRSFSDKEIVTISAPDVSVELTKTGELTITLIDQNNKAMAGKTINVILNKENHTLKTDSNGVATLTIANLEVGNYTAEISYAGSDNYAKAKFNSTVTITKIDTNETNVTIPEITSGKTEAVTISLPENATGNVTLTVDGKVVSVVNVTNGTATVVIPALTAGKHDITIAYSGDANYAGFSQTKTVDVKTPAVTKKSVKISAKNRTFKAKKKTKKYTIALKADGKAVPKVKVTLKIKGKTYKAKTNAKGKATFKITKLNKKGKYKATIKFAGNSNYKEATKKVKITVKK